MKMMCGGFENRSVDEPEIKRLASRGLSHINAETNSQLQLIKIVEARSQVVAGTNHHIKIVVAPNNDAKKQKTYKLKIWEKPWMNFEEITYDDETQ